MIIDLRSDTVTKPSKGMFEAMMSAELGDDVFGEDPTVNLLETKIAMLFAKEAALFCPSGTMTNQIAIKIQTQAGDELLCDENSHIYQYESGGIASNSGVQAKLLKGDRGRLTASQIEDNINPNYDWLAKTSLVCLENTINKAGGSVYDYQEFAKIKNVCIKNNLALHLDGARIFNAIINTEICAEIITRDFDSISVCLSKGLGAPIGSLLIGNKSLIQKARRVRKSFGGGMRQAGILAAAGIYALDNNVKRLKEDHDRAFIIGECLKNLPCIKEVYPVETNIVIFNFYKSIESQLFLQKLNEVNIKAVPFGPTAIRFVTHLDFNDVMLEELILQLKKINIPN